MEAGLVKGAIPETLLDGLKGRDSAPLTVEMWVKFQYIALIPTRATNFRFNLYKDGRLFFARNSDEANNPIYNTDLPEQPDRILPGEVMAKLKAAFKDEGFFQQPPFWEMKTRGGALMIVTARRGRQVHEVWYVNVNTPLTDLLFSITPEEHSVPPAEEQLASMEIILADQRKQLAKLQEEIDASQKSTDPETSD